ncbi:hypothetical protein WS62_23425 [Burkholderia sp. ABCPW 14]|uniref:hypothetical protein n=1 Tax=Burkholderia sp. ABCPW 14 TaxID=1637860 RepID=UPI000770C5E4|nr:hypothetical protein [Burkholderia sp. ABCPW 14]KVD81910.1 hypothetical protein WS62_23425 [Burkholderia sp. ABCPW 14]
MIIVGIDPGIHGAIATLTASDFAHVIDMPIRPSHRGGKIRNEVDPLALRDELRKLVPPDEKGIVVMEDLNAFIGGGARVGSMASQASLAATKAVVRTVCELAGLPITHVSPKAWQAFYGIATRVESTKKQSLRIAREMFGRELCPLERHDGRADALLIARFALRTMT